MLILFSEPILDRLDNTWIYVSNDEWPTTDDSNSICSKIIDGQFAIVTKECDCGNQPAPRRGGYVMLQREAGASKDQYLHLCEVEIFNCAIGYWGIVDSNSMNDCSMQCHCKDNNTCRVKDGYCYSDCEDTWWGPSCGRPCQCASGGVCNIDTGDCGPGGCKTGQHGIQKMCHW